MKTKITPEPIVQEIFQDMPTQYMIQQELQDIYNSLDHIRMGNVGEIEPIIVYMPEEELEKLEEPKQDNKFQEESLYEEI